MLVWWKKISSVVGELSLEGVMKPNPLRIENHLTFPLILASDIVCFRLGYKCSNCKWLLIVLCKTPLVRGKGSFSGRDRS